MIQRRYTRAEVKAMWDWYHAEPERTLQDVAVHFDAGGRQATNISSLFRRDGLAAKPTGRIAVDDDPYSTCMDAIKAALERALRQNGSMSEGEHQTLQTINGLTD